MTVWQVLEQIDTRTHTEQFSWNASLPSRRAYCERICSDVGPSRLVKACVTQTDCCSKMMRAARDEVSPHHLQHVRHASARIPARSMRTLRPVVDAPNSSCERVQAVTPWLRARERARAGMESATRAQGSSPVAPARTRVLFQVQASRVIEFLMLQVDVRWLRPLDCAPLPDTPAP